MGDLVNKEYLSKQFAGYSVVVKEQLDKKINIQQDVADKNKLLGINEDGKVVPVEAPSSVKVSAETDNQIEQKTDGIYVKDMSVKISAEQDNALVQKQDGLYVPTVAEAKVSQEQNNIIVSKTDGLFAEDAIVEIKVDGTAVPITDKTVDIALKSVTDLENYYDKPEVDAKIAEVIAGGEIDLSGYIKHEEVDVVTEEEIVALLGLSEEELEGITQLISDTEVRIDKTYSSSKIYSELNRILEEGKTYTLEELRVVFANIRPILEKAEVEELRSLMHLMIESITIDPETRNPANITIKFNPILTKYLGIDLEEEAHKATSFSFVNKKELIFTISLQNSNGNVSVLGV